MSDKVTVWAIVDSEGDAVEFVRSDDGSFQVRFHGLVDPPKDYYDEMFEHHPRNCLAVWEGHRYAVEEMSEEEREERFPVWDAREYDGWFDGRWRPATAEETIRLLVPPPAGGTAG